MCQSVNNIWNKISTHSKVVIIFDIVSDSRIFAITISHFYWLYIKLECIHCQPSTKYLMEGMSSFTCNISTVYYYFKQCRFYFLQFQNDGKIALGKTKQTETYLFQMSNVVANKYLNIPPRLIMYFSICYLPLMNVRIERLRIVSKDLQIADCC